MKGAYAFLDIESVMREQVEDDQQVKDARWKMHYRGIDAHYITKKITPLLSQWLKDNEIDYYHYYSQENDIGLFHYFIRHFPKGWEIEMIERQVRAIEWEATLSDEERRKRGLEYPGQIGRVEIVKVLYFTHDEVKRQSVAEHFAYNPRVQVCSTMQETAAAMDIPPEAFEKPEQIAE